MFLSVATRWCGWQEVKPQYVVRVKMGASKKIRKNYGGDVDGKNQVSCSIYVI
jgi:hypothetical protein